MDDDRDLPPLPIRPPEGPVAESSRRHSHRSKDRNSARDLATLLLLEQRDHRETQRELSRVTEELRTTTLRAEEAESRVLLATERLKSVNEARLIAAAEAARANESLGLYKFQLETAQNEIDRAQSVFNLVEKERYQAELAGAKSRTAARKLNEQHKIMVAREEGRRQGLQEGLEAGRLNVYRDDLGRGPATTTFGGSQFDDYDDFEQYEGLYSPGDYAEELDAPSPPRMAEPFLPTMNARNTPAPVPIPPPVPAPEPAPATAPLSPLFVPFHDIHPTPVHNEPPQPRHDHIDVPPDGYIPQTGPDSLPLVPPPHEFSRTNGSVAGGSIMSPRQTNHHHNPTPSQRAPSVRAPSVRAPSVRAPSVRATSPRQTNHHNPTPSQRAPSVRAPSVKAPSVRAESVRRAPSAAGSARPVQMPTPRMNPNILGMEREAQRSSWASASDFYGVDYPHKRPSRRTTRPAPLKSV
ncbi:hypothetical protein B0H17DRAFT_584236 [Mycena rosella]|uniref:Uncharacterized protein n=1 Tax=Mycena rosella TaxID=1033263 RepID=A0AAD7DFS7_MYCRO|nr:hypothetical protein B0H17DRAFT_584236 [Mycena rosella]